MKAIKKEMDSKNGCRFFAVRGLCEDEQYKVGDDARESQEWDFDVDASSYDTTPLSAGGTCGTKLPLEGEMNDIEDDKELLAAIEESIAVNKGYGDGRRVIIAGTDDVCCAYPVDDSNEARITNAVVIALVEE